MAEINDIYGSIYQNLLDAGCDKETTAQCMRLMEKGRYMDMLPILTRHRGVLLDCIHKGQKKIDCLDYLLYKLKKCSMEV